MPNTSSIPRLTTTPTIVVVSHDPNDVQTESSPHSEEQREYWHSSLDRQVHSPRWGEAPPPVPASAAQFGLTLCVVRCRGSCGTRSGRRHHRPAISLDRQVLSPGWGAAPPPVPASAAQFGLTLCVVRCRGSCGTRSGRRRHRPAISLDSQVLSPGWGEAPPPVPASVAQFGLTLGVVRGRCSCSTRSGRRHHHPAISLD